MKKFLKHTVLILFIGLLVTVRAPYSFAAVGELDTTFTTNIGTGFDTGFVNDIKVQSDGKILVGGDFTEFDGTTSNYIARLNSDGTLDTTFTTNIGDGFNDTVDSIAIQSDGKIVVGGGAFTEFDGTTSNYIARLNSDGTLDTTFTTNLGDGFDAEVYDVAIQSDGKIIAVGDFWEIDGTSSRAIARLNSDGTPDTTFTTNLGDGFGGYIYDVEIQSDGKILVGGAFNSIDGANSNNITRLNSDGTPDTTFTDVGAALFDSDVYAIKIQSDGKIIASGPFTEFNGTTSNYIARLNSDGVTLDTTFTTNLGDGFDGEPNTILIQDTGKIILIGYFTSIDGTTSNYIARLNSDGTPDTTFTTNIGDGFNATTYSAAIASDDSILVGGNFTAFDGTTTNYIAQLYGDPVAPTVSTTSSSSVTTTTATLTGNITATGGESNTARGFNYGLTTAYGSTTNESGTYSTGSYSLDITGLTCATTYHYRAFSTNSAGTSTGSDDTFTTSACPTSSSSSGSSAGSRARNLISMGKVDQAQAILNKFPNAVTELANTPKVTPTTPSTKVNTTSITSRLSRGTTNTTEVSTLQQFLSNLGYTLKVDGKFGPMTEQVVKIFQASHNLVPDGIVGVKTRGVMNGM